MRQAIHSSHYMASQLCIPKEGSVEERGAGFKTILDAAPIPMAIADSVGRCLQVNRALELLTEYGIDEIIGQTLKDLEVFTYANQLEQ